MADKKEQEPHRFWERYPFTCAKCGHEMDAAPSMVMTEFGINSGHGRCTKCGTFLRLKIVPNLAGHKMESQDWKEFLAQAEKARQDE